MRAENHPLFPLVVVADCWLQRLLVWTPGQTDLIKTVGSEGQWNENVR
ncbi:hypothetical protein STN0717CIT36_P21090 (plasmid) [Citrobacter portucalensis]|nr:hypothetical protein STN0717CIT36_P21090 [Citrobacter portucalensis]